MKFRRAVLGSLVLISFPVFAQIAAIACMVSVLYMWGVYRLGLIEYRSIWPKN